LRILYVLKTLPDNPVGLAFSHTWNLAEQMLLLGHQVSILCAGNWMEGTQKINQNGLEIIKLPYISGNNLPFVPSITEAFSYNLTVSNWLQKNKESFDIIHLQDKSGYFFAGKQGEIPLVSTFFGLNNIEAEPLENNADIAGAKILHRKFIENWEKNALYQSNHLIMVSQEMIEELRFSDFNMKRLTPKITQIYHGIKPISPTEVTHTEPNLLLYVGPLLREKGIFRLVEAMQNTASTTGLLMIGEGADQHRLETMIDTFGLQSKIQVMGKQTPQTILFWLTKCAFLVAPSLRETHNTIFLEAFSCGKTVLSTDLPYTREMIWHSENGWLIEPDNATQLTSAINYLVENAAFTQKMGREALQIVKDRFSWQLIARKTERIYGNLTGIEIKNRTTFAEQNVDSEF
jgi:glycosyltransferase involved in cell wall biosynthesis